MAEVEVTCEISCRKCNWSSGGTLLADESNVLERVFSFFKECSCRHTGNRLSGELLVTWKPLESRGS